MIKAEVILLGFIVLSLTAVFGQNIRIATGEGAPYVSENLEDYGYLSIVTTESFLLAGVETEYRFFPWKRSYEYAKNGQFDATFPWCETPERSKELYFSTPIDDQKVVVMHKDSLGTDLSFVDDLKDYRVGVIIGYVYGEEIDKVRHNPDYNFIETNSESQLLKMLKNDRLDVVISEERVALNILEQEFPEMKNSIVSAFQVGYIGLSVAFNKSPKGFLLMTKFEEGFKLLRESGRYDEIMDDNH